MRKFLLLAIISIISITAYCQDFSNKGKDFWVGYGFHVSMGLNGVNTGGNYQMVLYLATDSATTVTVSCPGNGYTATYNIPANTIFQTATLPKSGAQDCRLFSEGTTNRGIHIVATKPVVAYTHIYDQSISGATVLFPTNTLGKEYYSINFEQRSNNANSNCFFYVIACDTGTTSVEITPTATTLGGWAANTTHTVNLTQGQVYNVMGTVSGNNGVDLTGSKIKSIASGTGNCKKIAVFSGSGKLSIKCPNTGNGSTSDNYMAQAFPKAAWGKKFLTVPTLQYTNNYYRICVADPTTVVKVNGVVIGGLVGNFYYQIQNNTPDLIEGDKPITVAQYIPSQNECGGTGNGDPEMIYLSSVEQNISRVILYSTQNFNIGSHYLNVVLPNSGTAISSFRIDGAVPSATFVVHPQNSNYVYLQQNVSAGQHIVSSDSGFNITAYGYGPAESYGYNGGTNIKDLLTFITPLNPLSISSNVSACTGTPFYFSVTLPKHPDSLTSLIWDYHGFFGTHNDTINLPITADSTYLIGTTQVWRYKLNHTHLFSPAGVYPITITAGTVNSEGCGNSVIIDRDLFVYDPPVLGFKGNNNGCVTDSIAFTDTTAYPATTFAYQWWWDFGDGNFSTLKNPKHLYSSAGTYTVRYAVVSNVGCLSDTVTRTISITNVPTAKFGMSSPVCAGMPVTFSDTSGLVAPGSLIKWHWDFGDGFRITRTTNSDTTHIYSPWNPVVTDTLIVETNTGCKSLPFYRTFKVHPNPVPDFNLPAGVCLPWDSAHFINTSTIADATGGFGYSWNFGDPLSAPNNTSVLTNPAHYYNNLGPFSIKLITTSAAGCVDSITKVLSNIYPQAIAGFTVNPENCLTTATSFISTSNGNGSAIINYHWDFGDATTGTGSTVAHTYATPGIKTIKHWIVTDKGCHSDTATLTVIINPLPTANFISSGPYCVTKNVTFTDVSTPNAGNIINWHWDMGDGTILNFNNPNPFTHQYATTGAFNVTLIVTTDKGCISLIKTVVVNIQPLPVPSFTSAIECLPYGVAVFTNTSTIANASPMSYQWDFGDIASGANNTSALPNPSHYFSTVGPYTVTLTATSVPDGCITTSQQTVLNIYPQPGSAFTVAAENCLNTATSFTSNGNGNGSIITEYHWDFGDGSPFSLLQNPTHTYATAGTKTIKHWIVTDKGCYSDTTQHTVVINPLPTADYTYTTPDCETRLISFTDASVPNAGNLFSWQWNFGDGSPVDPSQNPTHIFTNAGTYNVTLTVSTTKGCISNPIANKAVVIHARPLAGFITPEVCLSDTYAQFLDTSKVALPGNISGWEWNFGDPLATVPNPNTSILQNPTHSYTAVGPYNIQLIATSNAGCKDTLNQTLIVNGSFPVANFTVNNPTTLCANDSVAIVEASTVFPGSITKVEIYWDNINFPAGPPQIDNVPFTGKVYKHLYLPNSQVTKTYQVRYRAYSGGVCVNDKLSTVTVNAAPKVQFNTIPDICYDAAPFLITQGSEIGGVPGSFAYSGPGIVNSNGLFNPVVAGVGTHSIKYTFTSSAAGCTDTISQTIKVLDTASAKFTFLGPVCEGTAAAFKEESTAPAGVVLNNTIWDFGDGSPLASHAPGSTFTHAFPGWGSYTVTMFNTSAYGCKSAGKVQQVYISPIPQTSFSFVQSSVCLPNAFVSFINNSTIADGTQNAFTYAWDFGDPSSGILNTSSAKIPAPHIYTGTGPYTVTLKVTSGSNCIKNVNHLVDFIHPQPKAAFDFSKPEVCIGDIVVFRDLTNGLDGSVVKWNWNFGDGNSGTAQQESHLYTAVKTYDVSLFIVNSRGCNSDTLTQQFTVHPYPVVDAGPDRIVLQGGSITIQSNVTGNDLQYLWSPATYLNNTAIASPTAINMQDDILYKLTVTARGGCKSSDNMFVKVLKAPKIPNTFTPNGDGMNELWLIEYLDTYPDNRVQVFTRTGQLVFESKGYKTPWDGKMNGKALPFDTYYYIIEPGSGRAPITGYVTIIK